VIKTGDAWLAQPIMSTTMALRLEDEFKDHCARPAVSTQRSNS
jgi:hypothetical protein